ncbi:MAG: alpha/beta fold hydrolase [Anaerolineae bacterium]|nr:alpha/beta fold hydrolase [Anaerolineae bacterium]
MAIATPTIMPGAEPFFQRGGSVGCLCLHGFTASPAEVRWLAQHLAVQGLSVYAPRLPGHGSDPRHLARCTWQDWYTATLDGYHLLRAQCERVVVVGHSMGGMLALLLAAHVPLDAAAVLASPAFFPPRMVWMAQAYQYMRPFTDQRDDSPLNDTVRAEQAARGEPVIGRVRYDLWSSRAVVQLFQLADVLRQVLPQVTLPLLLVYSEQDQTVSLESMRLIAANVASQQVEQCILRRSGHIVTQDVECQQVFAEVAGFVARMTAPQPYAP